jgi:phosphatidylinositol alpha-1,6-mannosyltransferase
MSLGLPSIGALNTGIEDAISASVSGELVNVKDDEHVCLAVERIVANYSEYSQNAIEWANSFQWKDIVNTYIERIEN